MRHLKTKQLFGSTALTLKGEEDDPADLVTKAVADLTKAVETRLDGFSKAGNRQFHKGKSGNKIDGAVAAVMAVGRASAGESRFITSQDWFTEDMYLA